MTKRVIQESCIAIVLGDAEMTERESILLLARHYLERRLGIQIGS